MDMGLIKLPMSLGLKINEKLKAVSYYYVDDTNLFLIIGIFITIISFPFVFFRDKMAERYNEAIRKNS